MSFVVEFDPPLPEALPAVVPADMDWPEVYQLSLGLKRHALTYVISGRPCGYDYADVHVLLGDLLGELRSLDSRSPHEVLISGYPVVNVIMHDDFVTFYQLGDPESWSAEIEIAEVRVALSNAANMLWGVISNRNRAAKSEA